MVGSSQTNKVPKHTSINWKTNHRINEGALTLTKLKEVIDQDKMNKPAFLAIITATDSFAYQREDGIYVIPIACLKP